MNTNKLSIAFLLSFFVAMPSFCQSINEKLGDIPVYIPFYICTKSQCSDIAANGHGKNTLFVSATLHGEYFIGWAPPCYACSEKEQDAAAAKALELRVKARFHDAKTEREVKWHLRELEHLYPNDQGEYPDCASPAVEQIQHP